MIDVPLPATLSIVPADASMPASAPGASAANILQFDDVMSDLQGSRLYSGPSKVSELLNETGGAINDAFDIKTPANLDAMTYIEKNQVAMDMHKRWTQGQVLLSIAQTVSKGALKVAESILNQKG